MISFVYFDIGGVIIRDISDDANWKLFTKFLGIKDSQYTDFDNFWESYEPKLNVSMNVDELIPLIQAKFDTNFPADFSLQNEFVKRFKKNQSIWPIIEKAEKIKPVGLLTNMYPGMLETIRKADLLPVVSWDIIVDSSIVGAQKPDIKIFEIAEQKANVPGNEIFFIDNSKKNIEAANKFGWQTFLYDQLNANEANIELLKILDEQLF